MMLKYHRLFALTLALLLLACRGNAQKIYLVSVGIADYPGTSNDLRLCANDARTVQWIYSKNKKAETALLTDGKATVANITKTMKSLYSKAGVNDIVVLFFSGHGTPGNFVCHDAFMSYDVVIKAMANSKARNKVIFADACFSGKIRQEGSFSSANPNADYSKANVMLFLSSRSDETSIESSRMKNGFFTAYLQRGLKGGADADRNRIVTAKELFTFVSKGVKDLSNDHQHPVMWGKFDDNMPVISW